MAKPDWLSIEDISRLWSEETGLDASALQKDLENWFAEFVEEPLISRRFVPSVDVDTITANRLMGKFGVRYLETKTFETYCEERGLRKPGFWFGGGDGDSRRDRPSHLESGRSPPEATSPRSGVKPSYEREEIGPELAACGVHKASRESTETSAEQNQQELIERAAAAAVKARQLRARLEAAVQKIADLSANIEANRAPSVAEAIPSDPDLPEAITYEPSASLESEGRAAISGRSPTTNGQQLRQTPTRQRRRGRAILVAGLAVSLVALMALGAGTAIHLTGNMPLPLPTKMADPIIGQDSATSGDPADRLTSVTLAGRIPQETAPAPLEAETGKLEPGGEDFELLSGPQASGIADPMAIEKQLAAAQREIVSLSAVVEASALARTEAARLHGENVRLTNELAKAKAIVAIWRQIQQQTEDLTEARQQDLKQALAASSAQVAALQRELEEAHRRIADLAQAVGSAEDEAVTLREELAARQQDAATTESPTGPRARVPSNQDPAADQPDSDLLTDAEDLEAAPEIEEILTASEIPSDPGTTETDALKDSVSLEDLLLEPAEYVGREVVVTGPVVWLLRRYWLQLDSADRSMLLDVEGLHSDVRNKLEDAVVEIEFLAQVRARIRGIVEREGAADYRLAASKLVLVD